MSDVSKLSDADLMAALKGGSVSDMSDDDLMAALGQPRGERVGEPDPQMKEFAGEVLSGDPDRSRAAQLQADYNRMSTPRKMLVAADDVIRQAVDAGTAGYADKLGGKIHQMTGIGPSLEERRQNTQDAYLRAPGAGMAAQVVGGVAGAGKLLGAAGALPGAAGVTRAVGATLPGRIAGGAAVGAGLGALDASGHDKDIGEGAAIGALGGAGGQALGEAVAGGVSKVAGAVGKKMGINQPTVRSVDELGDAADALYKKSDGADIIVKAQPLQRLAKRVTDDLAEQGYHPAINQEVAAVVGELERLGGQNASLKGVDVLRQIAGQAAGSPNAGTRRLASRIIDKIDEFTDTLADGDVLALNGKVGDAVGARKEARSLWSSMRKSETIQAAVDRAERRAAASGSGGNIQNALKQEINRILGQRKLSRGFTKEEKAVMQAIVRGTKTQNLARLIGKASPEGNGLSLILHIMSGGTTLPAAALGAVSKRYADAATPRAIEGLDAMVRNGGVMPAATPNATQRLAKRVRDPLGRFATVGSLAVAEED